MINKSLKSNRTLQRATNLKKSIAVVASLSISLISSAFINAQANEQNMSNDNTQPEISIYNPFDFADLYHNDQGTYLRLSGRLQLDSTWLESDQGDYNEIVWRRFRFGVKAGHGNFEATLKADINLNNPIGDMYTRLTDANISWLMSPRTELKILKQSAGFTLDGKTSSKLLLTPQRNNLSANLWFSEEYFTGITLKGALTESWSYNTGIFSGDGDAEISIQNGGSFLLLSTAKSLTSNDLWDSAEISFDYVYNDNKVGSYTTNFSQIISNSNKFNRNKWGLQTDLSWGKGDAGQNALTQGGIPQSDVFGLVLMPTYQTNEVIQWVARYTYLHSNEDNGLFLERYENRVVAGKGNQYQEYFGGVNWFLNGQKLKLQAGLKHSKMIDDANDGGAYDGWDLTLALRTFW
ncbi:hypothetical protein [Colwellia echini]|uniref:Alginate export domain-containing protein n=1 Tax=Colwellia echini TaxID=1982103 RepID=A0ABY3MV35_9GAMM|nr:hypothetical protein [Colwellia echini]TYK65054.1 hypothetical protein CWS31_012215 [Colwellia echini]